MAGISFKEPYPPSLGAGPSGSRSIPSASTSSAPSLKQRRVSLAVPSSARLVPAWSFRDDTKVEKHVAEGSLAEGKGKTSAGSETLDGVPTTTSSPDIEPPENGKKIRRKWTVDETNALVEGCKLYGVGNWKAMLKDPNLNFDSRSAVDLKDRFRTYFPDAYKQHYPNAKTHLSSKIRSTLPDGTSLFEKTRGKKRRPFTLEEDEALKAGYEKHGTVWATIVKDPAFQAQGRKSTDLRDRFRNAFPELYQLAGYKPRSSAKKKLAATALAAAAEPPSRPPARFTQDDQAVGRRSSGPVRRRRALTNEGLTAPQLARQGSQSVPESSANSDDEDGPESEDEEELNVIKHSHSQQTSTSASSSAMLQPSMSQDMDMDVPPLVDDFLSVSLLSDAPPWPASMDATNQQMPSWATPSNVASPSISQLSGPDYFRHSLTMSPIQRPTISTQPATIGKSAWPSQDWLTSANPRLEHTEGISSSASSFNGFSPVPSSPFSLASASFSAAASHGVLDRYDLPAPAPGHFSSALSAGTGGWGGDFISEVGPGDSHSTFSDPDSFAAPFRGFTHHSSYAGDLIFGARSHQPLAAGSGYAFGFGGLGLTGTAGAGHRTFSGTHTPALPGIDEAAALGAISLNDPADLNADSLDAFMNNMMEHHDSQAHPHTAGVGVGTYNNTHDPLDQLISLPHSTAEPEEMEMRITPPGTPVERARRTTMTPHTAGAVGAPGFHNRSISVPPAEHRYAALLAPPGSSMPLRPPLTPTRSMSMLEPLSGGGQFSLDGSLSYPTVDPATGHPLAWNPGEIPYLDMHYYTHGYGFDGFNPHGTPGEAGALDLAILNNSTSSATAPTSVLPSTSAPVAGPSNLPPNTGERPWQLKRHVPQSFSVGLPPYSFSALQPPGPTPQVQSGRAALAQTLPSASTPTRPNHSMHHRVQSAVSPQDLMLRPESQRRLSWDGGPP